ncbi:MAG: tRNA lysidine(34) synthetase TilS [Candidatus Marinimicrobia bacterium]|nr:tRNA lysidine(34) synthetase TilS [Candidatus Neomarinimicrobiota bacterium]
MRILCACSGGVDSTVLLHLLNAVGNLEISIIHFNHELRGEASTSDMNFVEQLGNKYNYPVHIVSENIQKYASQNRLSVEEAGSQRRRLVFLEKLNELDYDLLASGQQYSDQLETILINLYTGTGIRGLSGIGASHEKIIRPLLSFSRAQILKYADMNQLEYCEDQSNRDPKYLRNNIRMNLIPLLSKLSEGNYASIIGDITDTGTRLNKMLQTALEHIDNNIIRQHSEAKISLGMDGLADYFSPIQKALFDRAFQVVSPMAQGISEIHFKRLKTLMEPASIGSKIQLPELITAYRDRKHITLIKRSLFEWAEMDLHSAVRHGFPFFKLGIQILELDHHVTNPDYFWYEGNEDQYNLRMRKEGDKMRVDAAGSELSVNQILQEAHVAPSLKEYYPVLVFGDTIVWIPGIRTAFSALVDSHKTAKSEVRPCFEIQLDEGTFE